MKARGNTALRKLQTQIMLVSAVLDFQHGIVLWRVGLFTFIQFADKISLLCIEQMIR